MEVTTIGIDLAKSVFAVKSAAAMSPRWVWFAFGADFGRWLTCRSCDRIWGRSPRVRTGASPHARFRPRPLLLRRRASSQLSYQSYWPPPEPSPHRFRRCPCRKCPGRSRGKSVRRQGRQIQLAFGTAPVVMLKFRCRENAAQLVDARHVGAAYEAKHAAQG